MSERIKSPEFPTSPEPVEVSQELLQSVFLSKEFRTIFDECFQKHAKQKREFGFSVLKNPYSSEIWYGDVVGGMSDSNTAIYESTEKLKQKLASKSKENHSLINFHIHPYYSGDLVVPSVLDGDLETLNTERYFSNKDDFTGTKFIMPPVELIATETHENIILLAMQESLAMDPFKLTQSLEDLDEEFTSVMDQDEVIHSLSGLGYKAGYIHLPKKGKWSNETAELIRKFSFSPKKYS